MDCDLTTSVFDWMIEHPEAGRVFDELQLDMSCGGKSLEYACHQRNIDPRVVLERLIRIVDVSGRAAGDRGPSVS